MKLKPANHCKIRRILIQAIFQNLRKKIVIFLKSRFTWSNAITINPSISYMHYFLAAFSGNPLPKVTWWHSGVIFDSTDEVPRSRGGSIIGQAHDMFSQIFPIRFYEFSQYDSTNFFYEILCDIFFSFSNTQN